MISLHIAGALVAQDGTDSTFKPYGKFGGYAFGDFYYKAQADTSGRTGPNQYSGVPKGRNAFQFRRIYLGYDYYLHPKFSAQLLMAAEDGKDALKSDKYAFYIKYANIRWKNILPRTDVIFGQMATPIFSQTSEKTWNYRSIEKTIADRKGEPSYDLGIAVQGKIDKDENYGYYLMAGNGRGAKPENNNFKRFYGDIHGRFFQKKLMLAAYGGYEGLDKSFGTNHSRITGKVFAGYTLPWFTVGAEYFITGLNRDIIATNETTSAIDTLNGLTKGTSVFVRGKIQGEKLGFFARMDFFNPDTHFNPAKFSDYHVFSTAYDIGVKERFVVAGLDFLPVKDVHIMPNIWCSSYTNMEGAGKKHGTDLVYRLTVHFIY